MFKPTEEQIASALDAVNTLLPFAVGYRLTIKPLPWTSNLKAGEAEKYEALAKAGFVAQSEAQTEREERGSHVGIICHVGDGAYTGATFADKKWVKEGDVVVFNRYAGLRVDMPPGSGDFYHFCNDEDILGNYGVKV